MTRQFEAFVGERQLLRKQPLSALKGATLGIDANHFAATNSGQDSLISAIGGVPLSLRPALLDLLKVLKENEITPLFVFKGMQLVPLVSPDVAFDSSAQRSRAWQLYEIENNRTDARRLFDVTSKRVQGSNGSGEFSLDACPLALEWFQSELAAHSVDYVVAPYSSLAQLAYFIQNETVDAAFASQDIFLYGADKFIMSIETSSPDPSFYYVLQSQVALELGGISQTQLAEAFLACGSELYGEPFKMVEDMKATMSSVSGTGPVSTYKVAGDIFRSQQRLYTAVVSFGDPSYLDRFQRLLASIQFMPVLKASGKVEPISIAGNAETSDVLPSDLHLFIGQRLPNEYYYYLYQGIISPRLLNVITLHKWNEGNPTEISEGVETYRYTNYLDSLSAPMSDILNLLIQPLARYFHFIPTEIVRSGPLLQGSTQTVPKFDPGNLLFRKLDSWNLQSEGGTIDSLFKELSSPGFGEASITKAVKNSLKTPKDVLATVLARSLQVFKLVDEKTHRLTNWGTVYAKAIQRVDPTHTEALFVALSLLQAGYLNGAEKKSALIARVASLLPLQQSGNVYAGPLNRSLKGFYAFSSTQTEILRWTIEAVAVSLLVNGSVDRLAFSDADWKQLSAGIPFDKANNIALGIATKLYLDSESTENATAVKTAFPQAPTIVDDIKGALKFWEVVYEAVETATTEGLLKNELEAFKDANEWLKSKN